MKVLAFAASSSRQSLNKQLVRHAANLLEEGSILGTAVGEVQVEIIDLNDFEMPIYSSDRENENGIPEQAHAFRKKIGEADAVIVSFAEHNANYTAAYKNTFDWTSRIDQKVYQDKPMVLLATSPGPGGAANVLRTAVGSAPYFGMDVKADLSIASFYDNFDAEQGVIKNDDIANTFATTLAALKS